MTTTMMMTDLMIEHDKTVERIEAEIAEITRQLEETDAELAELDDLFC
jgi:prefoldin subunit 5